MENKQRISEIEECIVAEMGRLQYSSRFIRSFRSEVHHLADFIRQKTGDEFFSEELGAEYLRTTINFPFETPHPLTAAEGSKIRCVRRIGEYQLYGAVFRMRVQGPDNMGNWGLGDEKIITAYIESVQTADNSEVTKKHRIHYIRHFYEFLASQQVNGIHDISAQIISDYAMSLQGGAPVYTKQRLATLRFYFRFLTKNSILEYDWSFAVPKVLAPRNQNVPALWEEDDLRRLLEEVDRGSPAGKRDYAIILLVIQLGLRVSDISNLQLESLKWNRKEIELIQHKTGKRIIQPLLEDVGWAIIDYIKYGRPKVESPFVFLTVNAPYTQMKTNSVRFILSRHMTHCGIKKRIGRVSGMHSLRHALARRLLEKGTSLTTVADVLGHTSYASTSPYLKVDIESLRECALSLEEVLTDA